MTVIANLALRRFVGAVPPTIMGSVSGTGNAGCVWEVSASGSFLRADGHECERDDQRYDCRNANHRH